MPRSLRWARRLCFMNRCRSPSVAVQSLYQQLGAVSGGRSIPGWARWCSPVGMAPIVCRPFPGGIGAPSRGRSLRPDELLVSCRRARLLPREHGGLGPARNLPPQLGRLACWTSMMVMAWATSIWTRCLHLSKRRGDGAPPLLAINLPPTATLCPCFRPVCVDAVGFHHLLR